MLMQIEMSTSKIQQSIDLLVNAKYLRNKYLFKIDQNIFTALISCRTKIRVMNNMLQN